MAWLVEILAISAPRRKAFTRPEYLWLLVEAGLALPKGVDRSSKSRGRNNLVGALALVSGIIFAVDLTSIKLDNLT